MVSIDELLRKLGLGPMNRGVSTGVKSVEGRGDILESFSPVDGRMIGAVSTADGRDYEAVVKKAQQAFNLWKAFSAPRRGEIVRQM
jgi:aldehyde dehydrogenase (NAD+)